MHAPRAGRARVLADGAQQHEARDAVRGGGVDEGFHGVEGVGGAGLRDEVDGFDGARLGLWVRVGVGVRGWVCPVECYGGSGADGGA